MMNYPKIIILNDKNVDLSNELKETMKQQEDYETHKENYNNIIILHWARAPNNTIRLKYY